MKYFLLGILFIFCYPVACVFVVLKILIFGPSPKTVDENIVYKSRFAELFALVKQMPNCHIIYSMFSDLFEIERTVRDLGLSLLETKKMREQEATPILDKMKKWLNKERLTALPRSSFAKAVNYSLNNWNELNNYLLDGDLRIDNNLAEQEMKRVAIGRKNWLFFGSDNGGEQAEVLMSITSTCKRHGVNPTDYLKDVIQKLSENPQTDLDPLLPHNWKARKENSELEVVTPTPKAACA